MVGSAHGWGQPMVLLLLPTWDGARSSCPQLVLGTPSLMGLMSSPEDSGSTYGCDLQDSNARLVLDLISGFIDADMT